MCVYNFYYVTYNIHHYMKRSEVPHQQQSPTKVLAFDFRPAAMENDPPVI